MLRGATAWYRLLATLISLLPVARCELLTPPYFNLAEGRRITATSTCGEGTPGPELYCKLVGANSDDDVNINIIQGQVCDYCDPNDDKRQHPPENAIDGSIKWWQSPPLSRGSKFNEVNLTIDLGQEFHVAYVFIRMANSPRPGVWALERSIDNGLTYQPWQYFADTPSDCENYFGKESLQPITRDDSVTCETQFSKVVPLEGGEIVVSLVKNRPSANDFFNSTVLQEWSRATNVRLRLLRTKTLLGHLMSLQRQDPTVTRRYFYSIKDISIGGRCVCNGHASTCEYSDLVEGGDPYKLRCLCQHHTCGDQCGECCPGFVQKAWRQSKSNNFFECEPCNCFGHTDECLYDEEVDLNHESLDIYGRYLGGGVCQNCRHNTEGVNCDRCISGYYRPFGKHLNETDVCQPCVCDDFFSTGNCAEGTGLCECKPQFTPPNCDQCSFGYFGFPNCRPCECHINGTRGFQCEASGGQCPCKVNYAGTFCNECAVGFYEFPECLDCGCNEVGSLSSACDFQTGQCTCRNNFGGRSCEVCHDGYFNYPECAYCSCDVRGTEPGVCDKESGRCLCREGYGGPRCDQCVAGYYGYPNCQPCGCSEVGSATTVCDATGKCTCLNNFAGRTCDQCSPGFYQYPECLACNCDNQGSIGISCDGEGKCQCKSNFDGIQCERCKEGFYNFPNCEECNCDPAGVIATFQGCGFVPAGELCQCKQRVTGRICNECRPLFWNLQASNPAGCEECSCHAPGTVGGIGVCDTKTGQCVCKPSVHSRKCEECVDGTYNLIESNLFGCTDCGCDVGGSVNNHCDKTEGQCICRPRVTGRICNEPLQTHYFPTLYHAQYEAEDGRTPAGTAVRFGYNEQVFPDFSWKGYAVFSQLQNEIVHEVYIQKPTLYRMILRYINRNEDSVLGYITIKPENPGSDVEQTFQVLLRPNTDPELVTVAGPTGAIPSPLVMNPGRWSIHTKIDKPNVFLDYFVLLPAAFYEASILVHQINTPCTMGNKDLCKHYRYPSCNRFDVVRGEGGFLSVDGVREPLIHYFTDEQQLAELKVDDLPVINREQNEVHLDMRLTKPGRHVLLINYFSPEQQTTPSVLHIETSTQKGRDKGKVNLYQCQFTNLCRQAVMDKHGKVAVFKFDTNFISLVLKGDNSTNLALDSVVAVPFEKWSLDYIQPKQTCVKKDGQCILDTFPIPPYSKRVEFEDDNENLIATELPEGIIDTDAKLVYLGDTMIDIRGQVPNEGPYVFVVHYYQPDYPAYEVDILVHNGQVYEAKLPLKHCPSNSGCRSVVRQKNDGSHQFELTQNFHLSVKEATGKNMWLDYVIVVPAEHYDEKLLQEEPLDETGVFISQCGKNNFNIDTDTTGFCREAVFSLTSDFNNGALPCQCDFSGSLSFECEKFGGQCQCRPNVIGRKCEACRTGFYGFPECKPCDCPSTAFCDPESGACICPPRVTGEKCNQCIAYTYGFDPLIGCEECNCNPLGVEYGNLQCDLFTGLCDCKGNVVGRSCDHCQPGFWSFPYCNTCDCDLRGTTLEICDQFTAECHCKENVYGHACDFCKEGTFNLEESNSDGCTKCFCFGKTSRCTSSSFYFVKEIQMDGWEIASITYSPEVAVTPMSLTPEFTRFTATVELSGEDTIDKVVYFSAPSDYLGNKHTSYGGQLNFTVIYESGIFGNPVSSPDVILRGSGFDLLYFSIEQPAASVPWTATLDLIERNFVLPSGLPVTREQIMMALHNLDAMYIRATYWDPSINTKLRNVTMQVGVEPENAGSSNIPALTVEQCSCPPNYQGLSCEECAPGYFRAQTGPYGGFCTPCQCNGHAETCDTNTGICNNCKHNTTGDHCEKCAVGYHGDAQQGTPFDCLICACPLPIPSNNFAFGCDFTPDGSHISCDCMPGYYGARCESCSAGFFGEPERPGETCNTCSCSGNINPEEPGSCDSITGECLRCLNNTYGAACSLCAPGFFGDAVELKDCQTCSCDTCGTDQCDSYNGQCVCLPNVVGEKCDRCEYDHWGFTSCQGCAACDCEEASESTQCDDLSGQCRCKPGVAGRRCERCAPGFWNYGPEGCVSCGCNTGYSVGVGCNPNTGQCECLPGVIGEKCDHCPYRWVLIPDQGCFECDSCNHDLLDVTDEVQNLIDPVMLEFDTVALGYFTTQRLIYINDSVTMLYPKVDVLDPERIDLTPLQTEIDSLEKEGNSLNKRANYASENSGKLEGNKVWYDALEVEQLIQQAVGDAKNIVGEVTGLAFSLDSGTGPQVDLALQEAQLILGEIESRDLSTARHEARQELEKAQELLARMKENIIPVHNQSHAMEMLREKIITFEDKLGDLRNYSTLVHEKAGETEDLNLVGKHTRLSNKVDTVKNVTNEAGKTLTAVKKLNEESRAFLDESKNAFEKFKEAKERTSDAQLRLDQNIADMEQEIREVGIPVYEAREHAKSIQKRADELDNMLSDTRDISQNALDAANAYTNIKEAIEKAMEEAHLASTVADNATALSAGLYDRTGVSEEKSTTLTRNAQAALDRTKTQLAPKLDTAREIVTSIQDRNQLSDDSDKRINNALEQIPAQSLEPMTRVASIESENADKTAQQTLDNINDIVYKLPQYLVEAKQIPKDVDDTSKKVAGATTQVDRVNKVVPDITNLMDHVKENQNTLGALGKDVAQQIEELKMKVAQARDLANRIKLGVSFYPNTTLELKNPEGLAHLATSTHISTYFNTTQPNGFLLYLGNEIGTKNQLRRAKTDDFLALEIENGFPVLTIDLGSGPQRIVSDKFVSDGVWYQAIIDRTGKHAKLTIKEEGSEGRELVYEKGEALSGTHSILNLDQELSKLFVGGYPTSFNIQPAVKYSSFEGQVEELMIGGVPVGLWNFDDASNNEYGARDRDKLVNLQPSTGFRFDGEGYAALDSDAHIRPDQIAVSFSFKSLNEDGLMFLVAGNPEFMSAELREGKVVTQIRMGGENHIVETTKKFNDGRWHSVDIRKSLQRGVVRVDTQIEGEITGTPGYTDIRSEKTYFGGYPGEHSYPGVTNIGFDGCIDKVEFDATPVDLGLESEAFGVTPGCPVKVASIVSFDDSHPGFVRWPNASADNFLQLTLKLRTKAANGMIYFAESRDKLSSFSLAMVNGMLVLNSQRQELSSTGQYNDGEWHVLTATHSADSLRLDVDDFETFSSDSPPPQLYILYGNMYFGGIPSNLTVEQGKIATTDSFIGCLGDATVNGQLINFANSTRRPGAILGKCHAKDHAGGSVPERPREPTEPKKPVEKVTKKPKQQKTTTLPPDTVPTVIPETTTPPPPPTTVPPTPPPVPDNQCVLPIHPAEDPDARAESGNRFGSVPWGRLEYNSLPANYKKKYEFSIEFKTYVGEGILFYVADKNHIDYIAVYMKNGKVFYGFNCGSGSSQLNSSGLYNDGIWHTLTFSRQFINGKLVIDGNDISEGSSKGSTKSINVNAPFFVGGITEKMGNLTKNTLKGVNRSFEGCLRNFRMNDLPVVDLSVTAGTAPCSEKVESGAFFSADGGFLRTREPFRVGLDIHIKLDIKPRNTSGILVSVHGRRDYLVLQLIDGAIKISVDNGKGPIFSLFTPPNPYYFCDGQWHSIEVIKAKTVVTLSVDKILAETGIGTTKTATTDTNYPLYVGGHQKPLDKMRGFQTKNKQFVGCIRNLVINDKEEPLSNFEAVGNVTRSFCPTI